MTMLRNLMAASVATAAILAAGSASADQFERWVDIVNLGDSAIYSVHITDVDTPVWGNFDLLGQYVIPPGSDMVVEPVINRGYCLFDVLVTYETGREVTMWGVNLCEITHLVVDEYGMDMYVA